MRVLFIFSHHDDEAGVFHEINQHVKSGHDVFCHYYTRAVDEKTNTVRKFESIAVLTSLGVKLENIIFCGERINALDGKLLLSSEDAFISIETQLQFLKPTLIVTHAWEGGHHDHDFLHALVVLAAYRLNLLDRVFQFPLYRKHLRFGPFFKVLSPLISNGKQELKYISLNDRLFFLHLCTKYLSQTKTWIGLLPMFFINYFVNGHQVIQEVKINRIFARPHSGILYYEYRGWIILKIRNKFNIFFIDA
jgi:GlcNAc-PI de-N-acetylase